MLAESNPQANRALHFSNGNLLEVVRAGQAVKFECGAASQPKPRIRWFKLVRDPHQHKQSTSLNKQQHWPGSAKIAPEKNQTTTLKIDETSIRSLLMQTNDPSPFSSMNFHLIELPLSMTTKSSTPGKERSLLFVIDLDQ